MGMGSLTAAQTQFLSQFSHSNDALKQPSSAAAVTATTQSNSYSSMYQTSSESEQQSAQTNSYQSVYHPSSQSITSTYSTSSGKFLCRCYRIKFVYVMKQVSKLADIGLHFLTDKHSKFSYSFIFHSMIHPMDFHQRIKC